ncbi:MAG: DUF503 domain-containing protein [Firmicutes bacterium]|nr:DUF503 domain-containing protein [Bacillota bacterium]
MVLALMTLELRFQAHSLKDKRKVVKSLLSRMARRYNLSVHEADYHDVCNRACLAAAWVGANSEGARRVLEGVIALAEQAGAELIRPEIEFY